MSARSIRDNPEALLFATMGQYISSTVSLAEQRQTETNGHSTAYLDGRSYADVARGHTTSNAVETSMDSPVSAIEPQSRTDGVADAIPNGAWRAVAHNGSVSLNNVDQGPNGKLDLGACKYLPLKRDLVANFLILGTRPCEYRTPTR